jgi:UDP-glucose 4-epimerase/UDP-arabinose 4-epimerase
VTGAILVAGGAGYIGSHTAKALAETGWRPVVFDNLGSGHRQAVQWGPFIHGDIRDGRALREAMTQHQVAGVIHFAGLIEVGRSMARPDLFYEHNVAGTATLLSAMKDCGVGRLVFSSSAAVYGAAAGDLAVATIPETAPKAPASVYGDTKLIGERMIEAHGRAFGLGAVALRYFNAAGADAEGVIGEAHHPETHLIPLAIEAALGLGKPLTVFGADFETPDGSCLRDYIHVSDLARAHVAALEAPMGAGEFEALNVGTGAGHSVFEVIAAIDEVVGRPTPFAVGARRPGDPASLIADARQIRTRLNWAPRESALGHIAETAIRWRRHPRFGLSGPEPARSA